MKNFFYFFIIFIVYLSITSDNTSFVFDELEESNSYYVEIENLNTNNISCIENLNIQAIEIEINPIYKIDKVFFYKDLNFFIRNVIRRLKDKGYYIEANKYLIEPIKIKNILVFNNKNKILEELETCNLTIKTLAKN